MSSNSALERQRNKTFVINNKYFLKQYAQKKHHLFGSGIIVINLLQLNTDLLDEQSIPSDDLLEDQEPTIYQPVSYIPEKNFWFKMLSLKIKKKYQIELKNNENNLERCLVVFIKDTSIEHFSIYSLKL